MSVDMSRVVQTSRCSRSAALSEDDPQSFSRSRICAQVPRGPGRYHLWFTWSVAVRSRWQLLTLN